MKYKGYHGHVVYDEEAKLFHGEVVGLKDVITFQGTSVDELEQAFKDSVDDYLAFCKKLNRAPEKPFSGKLVLRLPPEVHQQAATKAKSSSLSLNTWIWQAIQQVLGSPIEAAKVRRVRAPQRRTRSPRLSRVAPTAHLKKRPVQRKARHSITAGSKKAIRKIAQRRDRLPDGKKEL